MRPQHWAVCKFSLGSVYGPSGGLCDVVRGWWLLAVRHSAHHHPLAQPGVLAAAQAILPYHNMKNAHMELFHGLWN